MRWGLLTLGCLLLGACQQDAQPRSEAETHWLDRCAADADCGGGGQCVCGVCTDRCDAADVCDGDARPACASVRQLAAICGDPVAACVRECVVAEDCGAGGFECRQGVCVGPNAPPGQAPEPAAQPEPEAPQPEAPEPDAQPEPDLAAECVAACDRARQCYLGECDAPPAAGYVDDCRTACEASPALRAVANAQADCGGLLAALGAADPALQAECRGAPEPEPAPEPEVGEPEPAPEPEVGEPEPQPEPEVGEPEPAPEPEPDDLEVDCADTCERLIGCAEAECPAEIPPGAEGDCLAQCFANPAMIAVADAQPECAGLVETFTNLSPDFAALCDGPPPEPEPADCPDVMGVLQPNVPLPFDTEGGPVEQLECQRGARETGWYAFVLDAPATVVVEVVASEQDTVLMLLPSCDAALVECNDDGGAGVLSRVRAPLPAGRHLVGVNGFDPETIRGRLLLTVFGGPACSNGIDDDDDGLVDFLEDPDCVDAADDSEAPAPACSDGIDNDGDGLIDAADGGCVSDDDDSEDDGVIADCADGIDNDGDGAIDWPMDPDCRDAADVEAHLCAPPVEATPVPDDGIIRGAHALADPSHFASACGGAGMPDAVYALRVEPGTERLRISADHPGTDNPLALSLRRRCDAIEAEVACSADLVAPLSVDNPAPGDWYLIVDALGVPGAWATGQSDLALVDPQGYQPNDDIVENGWRDGGRDAFDSYGNTSLTIGGVSERLDVSLGQREVQIGGADVRVTSALVNNTWRLEIAPVAAPVLNANIEITGNLGSDAATVAERSNLEIGDVQVPVLHTRDDAVNPRDPPVTQVLVPSHPADADAIRITDQLDRITFTAAQVRLPLTLYVTPSYAPRDAVVRAIAADIDPAAAVDPDRIGGFEVHVVTE